MNKGQSEGRQAGETDVEAIAAEAFALLGAGRQIAPFSDRYPNFGMDDAYRVAAAVRMKREARGERPVGRKIGFTNRTIWAEYNVYAPMWGHVYDRTLHAYFWRSRQRYRRGSRWRGLQRGWSQLCLSQRTFIL